ncbi:aldehyde dehydrogenase family protein [Nguyenibacter vanlangensis]|uniref:Aldehyde dehydrogenase family protein n=1 Tax=Nguyenibacter vanlangensis TaxID=1216886 RepID=A0A7Y7M5S2_9PROT|nr:aldehyde dehydrogenase family protein [Nguyenibacter vanlangensis]NVN09788.1 aldehyde dehydrogenase family protein [Nguyenibacter vanlangensis]
MQDFRSFYIDGSWVDPMGLDTVPRIDPTTGRNIGLVAVGSEADIDRAVAAARRAALGYRGVSTAQRADLLRSILAEYTRRSGALADAIVEDMGAPVRFARSAQVPAGMAHLSGAIRSLLAQDAVVVRGRTHLARDPIGVCGFITPWNWPLNQILAKVAPALAAGCAIVLKPSEQAASSAQVLAEIIAAAGVPRGVFNLVHGDGRTTGAALSAHPGVDMISITGSVQAGVEVAAKAAPGVKRVAQELGGKSAHIIFDDDNLRTNVARGVRQVMLNSGQSCNAPTRMLVPRARMEEVIEEARTAASRITVGAPSDNPVMGPVAHRALFNSIQMHIAVAIANRCRLVAGGAGRPEGLPDGFYVKPTIFANVDPKSALAQEEIFGPVLAIIGYQDIEEAITIANDTEYGLAAYVSGADTEAAYAVSRKLQAGQVSINGAFDFEAPFGGFKKSGNGREGGDGALDAYQEIKAIMGAPPRKAPEREAGVAQST